jgi:polygalacturonase
MAARTQTTWPAHTPIRKVVKSYDVSLFACCSLARTPCSLTSNRHSTHRAAITDCRNRALAAGPNTRAVVVFSPVSECDEGGCPLQEPGTQAVYITGAINITSNMTFRIPAGATLQAALNTSRFHYPLVVQYAPYGDGTTPGWMPNEASDNATDAAGRHLNGPSLSPFIGSEVGAVNIRIDGDGGTIDGGGVFWWERRATLGARAPRNIEPFFCRNFTMEDVTVRNPGDWNVHPLACDGVVIRNVTIYSPPTVGNTDGLDPDFCANVLVEDSTITSGDDAIAVKAGSGYSGGSAAYAHAFEKRVGHGSENMTFRRLTINHRWPTIGSNCAGHIRNISFLNSTIGSNAEQMGGLFIKTYAGNGGTIEDVLWQDLTVYGKVRCASVVRSCWSVIAGPTLCWVVSAARH